MYLREGGTVGIGAAAGSFPLTMQGFLVLFGFIYFHGKIRSVSLEKASVDGSK